ncbi:peptidoglycan DD-metalloendopeptidase family protein [Lysobacter zhanggongensis]|uniref:Peptidoglycan DD-metalloendopeptidase family protein n=1 Tax=Lysobacter zhanggongensis TaxID=1774951 RepID=A0ABU7YS40_9GAMM
MTAPQTGTERRQRLKNLREAALHRPVLARHLSNGFNGRWSRRQWVQASLFATLGMLVASIVPGFDVTPVQGLQGTRQSMALTLPPLPVSQSEATPGDSWQVVRVQPGQTLGALFQQMGVPATTMYRILEQPGARQALTRLRPGTELAFDLPLDGPLRAFRFDRDNDHRVELTIKPGAIVENVIKRPSETRTVVASGEISSSLYAAARKAGLSPGAIATMTGEIFQYDIDFTDAQKGDRFSVVYEQIWREGERIGTGNIAAATFATGGKTYSGFRFEHEGKVGYYTADGRPLKKAFIRMPIPYARITSGFSKARKHPVLGRTRAHQGVDYGAGTGTPIHAAGDARVSFVGWKGGYGRTVVLDHGKGYTTLYAHMSRFGKYKPGQSIKQGTVIGYVGSSGLATGPHLHYEFRIGGVHRNPLTVTMPPPEPLKGAALAAFRAQTGPALARIQQVEDIMYAKVEPASEPAPAKADKKA